MAKDYAKKTRHYHQQTKSSSKRYLLPVSAALIVLLVGGLFLLRNTQVAHSHDVPSQLVSKPIKKPAVKQKAPALPAAPKFDFYTMLKANAPVAEESDLTAADSNQHYLLQASAVKRENPAERLKAQLILLGFDAFVKKVERNDETWYYVYLGPYDSLQSAKQHQQRLLKNNIKALTIKADN